MEEPAQGGFAKISKKTFAFAGRNVVKTPEAELLDVLKKGDAVHLDDKVEAQFEKAFAKVANRSKFASTPQTMGNSVESQLEFKGESSPKLPAQEKSTIYTCEPGEVIISLQAFQHYAAFITNNQSTREHSLKVFNYKTSSIKRIDFEDPLYELEPELNFEYNTQFYNVIYRSSHLPEKVLCHNMALATNDVLQVQTFPFFQPEHFKLERIAIPINNGTSSVPALLVYHKNAIAAPESVIVLKYNEDFEGFTSNHSLIFKPYNIPLLEKGFMLCYPLRAFGGAAEKESRAVERIETSTKMLKEVATSLLKQGVAKHLLLHAEGELAGLVGAKLLASDRDLFEVAILENGVYDLLSYLRDVHNAKTTKLFGDPLMNAEDYAALRKASPYFEEKARRGIGTTVLLAGDSARTSFYQSGKMIAKFREDKGMDEGYLREISSAENQETARYALINSFLMHYGFLRCHSTPKK